jgi:hypothetical protein
MTLDVRGWQGGRDHVARVLPSGVHDAPDGYEGLTRIGQGGFAVVYRALDTRFDRIVALKILRSDSLNERQLRRFSAECLATGRVSSHPNIVTVYDAGTTAGHRPWLAMEYCSGGSLAEKVARLGPLAASEVISVGIRLCGALTAAHDAGVLHRDVKPHNVLLTSYGEPALADFGIASVGLTNGTATETAAYTVVHAAPEILEGNAGTPAADLYSLGSTLYTLLAGQAPFAAEASIGLAPLVSRILRNDLPAITRPGVPPGLELLLRKSMAAQPRDRPASAAELGEHFADLARRLAREQPASGLMAGTGSADVPASRRATTPASRPAAPPAARPAAPPARPAARSAARPAVVPAAGPTPPPASRPAARPATLPTATPDARCATLHRSHDVAIAQAIPAVVPLISARRLLVCLGGVLGVLLAMFMVWGPAFQDPHPAGAGSNAVAAAQKVSGMAPAAPRYAPKDVAAGQGSNRGELTVTWRMPIRPDVVATVVYVGAGNPSRARAVVSYRDGRGVPRATLRGLPRAQRICLSVANVVSVNDTVTNAVSKPVCAVPR